MVKGFECEDCSCFAGNHCIFVPAREGKLSKAVDVVNHICCIHHTAPGLPPPAAGAGEQYRACTVPFMGSSQASEGEFRRAKIPWS